MELRAKNRIYIMGCSLKTTKTGKQYYSFYTHLGKNKGIVSCKCWDTGHDLTQLKCIENVVVDLTSHTSEGKRYYELVIKTFGIPLELKKKDLVKVNDYFKTPEEFTPEFQEAEKEQLLLNAIDNYTEGGDKK